MKKALGSKNCFVCGEESKIGLRIKFEMNEKGAWAVHTPRPEFESFDGVVHGGILCTLLDEVMWKTVNGLTGAVTMTAKLDVRFKKPADTGEQMTIQGEIIAEKVKSKRKIYEAKGIITDSAGNILAEGTGLYVEPANEKRASGLAGSLI